MSPANKLCIDERQFQIVKLQYLNCDIIAIYISPSLKSDRDWAKVSEELEQLLDVSRHAIICGDMNCDPHGNIFSQRLYEMGFGEVIQNTTHEHGRQLDHFYVKPKNQFVLDQFLHPLYFSDHDAICVTMHKTFFYEV